MLVISAPFPNAGGGSLRALRSIKEYTKYFDVHLFLPHGAKKLLSTSLEHLRNLVRSGIVIGGFSKLPVVIDSVDSALSGRVPTALTSLIFSFIAKPRLFVQNDYGCIISLHEDVDSVYAGYILSNLLSAPALCLLQLPPFYGSKERLRNILKAHILWRKCMVVTSIAELLSMVETVAEYEIMNSITKKIYGRILRKYDMVLAVSKAIPYEMGSEWINIIHPFDPGVSLDKDDLKVIEDVKAKVNEKEGYIVFGGRPIAGKGVVEALLMVKYISRSLNNVKLIFTGSVKDAILKKLMHICRRLGIEDKVIFTGFLPRDKRFEVVAKAKAMLYPSHIDGFPYAVLEALHLGTPVVAYDIPALQLYYSQNPGVKLVKEFDLEALAMETINVLERGIEAIEPPKIPSWVEIMNEEITIIEGVMRRMYR